VEAFVGDVMVCTLQGDHLQTVTEIKVEPMGKGITVTLGDPLGRLPEGAKCSPQELTVTFEVGFKTYPGEKRILLISPQGSSDPLPFLIMM
jgi:hypothetical protein